jgi:hypothetical protein
VRARITADTGAAVLEDAAREKLLADPRDDGALRDVLAREAVVGEGLQGVQVIRHQPK